MGILDISNVKGIYDSFTCKNPRHKGLCPCSFFSKVHFCTCVTWAVTSESKYDFTLFNCKMIHLNLAYIIWIKVRIMCGLHSSISIKQCRFIIYLFKVHYVCIRENRIHYRSSCIQKKNPKEAQHSFDHSSTGYQFSK